MSLVEKAMEPVDLANASFGLFMESQFWTAGELLEFQRSQLGQLLRHAKAQVPFYASRLDAVMGTDGELDWDKWREIPILTRVEAADSFDGMQADELPAGHGPVGQDSTSGSTGHPLQVRYPQILLDVCKAVDWRAHTWWKLDWSKPHVQWHKYNESQKANGPHYSYGPWGPAISNRMGHSYIADLTAPIDVLMARLKETQACYLSAQGSNIFAAALAMQQRGETVPLDTVCSHSVAIEEDYAPAIKAAFGARLHAIYSSKEAGRIAYTCAQCGQYHVNAESVLVEILRDDGQPCDAGETGRVIVTPFFNTAQPFIRYEQGDLAAWSINPSCSISLPSISGISGRTYHLFRRKDGTPFMPTIVDSLRENLAAQFWQFAQVSGNEIEVRYKAIGSPDAQREKAFAALVRQLLEENYNVTYRHLEKLPLTSSGKFLKYSYEVKSIK